MTDYLPRHRKIGMKFPRTGLRILQGNLVYLWHLSKANTMDSLQKIRNEDFQKSEWEYSQAKLLWGISTTREQNDCRKEKAKIIRLAFERYAKGNQRLEDISNFWRKRNRFEGWKENPQNPCDFYLIKSFHMGLFNYAGELMKANTVSIISKKLFDSVQEVMKLRQLNEKLK